MDASSPTRWSPEPPPRKGSGAAASELVPREGSDDKGGSGSFGNGGGKGLAHTGNGPSGGGGKGVPASSVKKNALGILRSAGFGAAAEAVRERNESSGSENRDPATVVDGRQGRDRRPTLRAAGGVQPTSSDSRAVADSVLRKVKHDPHIVLRNGSRADGATSSVGGRHGRKGGGTGDSDCDDDPISSLASEVSTPVPVVIPPRTITTQTSPRETFATIAAAPLSGPLPPSTTETAPRDGQTEDEKVNVSPTHSGAGSPVVIVEPVPRSSFVSDGDAIRASKGISSPSATPTTTGANDSGGDLSWHSSPADEVTTSAPQGESTPQTHNNNSDKSSTDRRNSRPDGFAQREGVNGGTKEANAGDARGAVSEVGQDRTVRRERSAEKDGEEDPAFRRPEYVVKMCLTLYKVRQWRRGSRFVFTTT